MRTPSAVARAVTTANAVAIFIVMSTSIRLTIELSAPNGHAHRVCSALRQKRDGPCKPRVPNALDLAGFEVWDFRSGCAREMKRPTAPAARRGWPRSDLMSGPAPPLQGPRTQSAMGECVRAALACPGVASRAARAGRSAARSRQSRRPGASAQSSTAGSWRPSIGTGRDTRRAHKLNQPHRV